MYFTETKITFLRIFIGYFTFEILKMYKFSVYATFGFLVLIAIFAYHLENLGHYNDWKQIQQI